MAQLATPLSDRHVRLVPCPHCDCRRRGLAESEGRLVGHCLRCGELLDAPLEVERPGVVVARRAALVAP
jgi:hypothetical protein